MRCVPSIVAIFILLPSQVDSERGIQLFETVFRDLVQLQLELKVPLLAVVPAVDVPTLQPLVLLVQPGAAGPPGSEANRDPFLDGDGMVGELRAGLQRDGSLLLVHDRDRPGLPET